jgi:hypothetical protein
MPTKKEEMEFARISMMDARRALEEYEARKGVKKPNVHSILIKAFQKAAANYLRLSEQKP